MAGRVRTRFTDILLVFCLCDVLCATANHAEDLMSPATSQAHSLSPPVVSDSGQSAKENVGSKQLFDTKACRQPLSLEDTLCGTTDKPLLRCHTYRAQYNYAWQPVEDYNQIWINVCMFQPPFRLENFTNLYDCRMTYDLGPVNCTTKQGSDSFKADCVFTFYNCREKDLSNCFVNYPRVLEDGGKCAAKDNWCPSENLYSLTTFLYRNHATNAIVPANFTNLTPLVIRPPMRCLPFAFSSTELAFLSIGVIGILIGIGLGSYRVKKLIEKTRFDDRDPIILAVESVLGDSNTNQELVEIVDTETPFPFKRSEFERGGSEMSRDTGFDESDVIHYATLAVHDESSSDETAPGMPSYLHKANAAGLKASFLAAGKAEPLQRPTNDYSPARSQQPDGDDTTNSPARYANLPRDIGQNSMLSNPSYDADALFNTRTENIDETNETEPIHTYNNVQQSPATTYENTRGGVRFWGYSKASSFEYDGST